MTRALAATSTSEVLTRIMGHKFVELYCRHRAAETAEFENYISAREYDWYL
jgi:glutamine synthetase